MPWSKTLDPFEGVYVAHHTPAFYLSLFAGVDEPDQVASDTSPQLRFTSVGAARRVTADERLLQPRILHPQGFSSHSSSSTSGALICRRRHPRVNCNKERTKLLLFFSSI